MGRAVPLVKVWTVNYVADEDAQAKNCTKNPGAGGGTSQRHTCGERGPSYLEGGWTCSLVKGSGGGCWLGGICKGDSGGSR